ncbi:hypothetical protein Prum_038350 [Phytohabitans rumicis]|uniref:Uncharacterized protein n=1 Tax=Phytohabitans rumicis TaxID=1076125 RepID=A0A6V8KYJ9_9ACTN|nr:hypothetical protein Prum_038350 [Phytohabitans rumicis]
MAAGERLTAEDVEALADADDLAWLGRLAHGRRVAAHGERVTFLVGEHGPDAVSVPVGASPAETLRAFALARLAAPDNAHVTGSTAVHGAPLAQLALNFGADDLLVPADTDRDEVVHLIWDAGLRPVERDAEHNVVREYDPPVPLAERRAEPQRVWA